MKIPTSNKSVDYEYENSWKDQLSKYNGKEVHYDAIGNLTEFDGWTYTWEGGRQLKEMQLKDDNGNTIKTVQFKYNHNGLRTQKKVVENGITTYYDYTLHGKLITHLTKRVVNSQNVETDREELHFFYDSQSRPAFVEYDNAMYRYVHNLQGDIVAIVDAAGNAVVEYMYDAWGKPIYEVGSLLSTLGNLNPFRYRGYVWDKQTEMYYLRSRYYNPMLGRFILADLAIADGLFNLFSYTNNIPVNNADTNGFKTYAVGYQTTGILGCFSVSIAEGRCWDDLGNEGIFITYAGLEGNFLASDLPEGFNTTTIGLGSLAVSDFYQTTNLESIEDLNGVAGSIGSSITVLIGFGYDLLLDKPINDPSGQVIGSQCSIGVGIGLDFAHASNTYTQVTVTKRATSSTPNK